MSHPAITAGVKPGTILIELTTGLAGIDRLVDGWTRLADLSPDSVTIFQTPGWLLPALRRAYPDGAVPGLRLVAVHDADGLAMIAPLAVTPQRGVRVLSWLGDPFFEYGDVVARPDCDVERLFAAVVTHLAGRERIDALHLRKVRGDAAIVPYLSARATHLPDAGFAPFVDLSGARTFDDYLATHNPRTRKSNRRKRRKLAELGAISFEIHGAGATAAALAGAALRLKAEWIEGKGLVSRVLADPAAIEALEAAATDPASGVRVSALKVADAAVAIEIGFVRGDTYYSYLAAIDPEYARFSPGSLQLAETLAWCHAEGIGRFDLLGPDGDYKRTWARDAVAVGDWAEPRTIAGFAYVRVMLGIVRPALKAAFHRSPDGVRRVVKRAALHRRLVERLIALLALGGLGLSAFGMAE